MSTYQADFRIRYTDVDRNNIWSPIAVMQYLQEIGCLHSDREGAGLYQDTAWVIIHWKVKIFSKMKWNEDIHIDTWISGVEGPYCIREYKLTSKDEVVGIATSRWVLTDSKTHRLLKLTDDMISKFGMEENKKLFNEPFLKLREQDKYTYEEQHVVHVKDIDTNQHVNNIKYIELAYDMLGENNNINSIEAMYKHSSVLGDTINLCRNQETDGSDYIVMKNVDKLSCIVRFGRD